MLLSDLSTTLTESKKPIKSGLLAGIDTSRDNGASAASKAASEDSDENDTLEEEYYEDPQGQQLGNWLYLKELKEMQFCPKNQFFTKK